MENKILELLKNNNGRMNVTQLNKKLNKNIEDTLEVLREMDEKHLIALNEEMDVYLIDQKKYFKGLLRMNMKGFGFVSNLSDPESDDYFVPPVNLNNAITMDTVVYELQPDEKKPTDENGNPRFKANVVSIISREKNYIVGEIQRSQDGKFLDFISNDQSLASFRFVMVNKKEFNLVENQIVKVKVLRSEGRKLFVRISKIIGNALKAADRILSIAEEFNIKIDFNKSTLENAREVALPAESEKEEIKRRKKDSLINKMMVTIDGVDSKDLDDSICVEKSEDGKTYKLIVAIADVAHYVKPKSPLDNEALMRGNSTYLVNVVLPMLPEVLSNGVCSLNPNELKLSMACEIVFDLKGNMISKRVFETTMISKARLNYKQVNEYFETGKIDEPKEVANMLDVAKELHEILNIERERRGTINFEIREPKIVLDSNSNVVEISSRTTGESEKLIENFMVSANEAVAEIVAEKELPFVYRNHGNPDEGKLIEWYASLKNFGIDIKLTEEQKLDPKNINKTLKQIDEQIEDPIEKELLNISLLRYMEKAKYGPENIGHFGLASKCYTHFTSPIRRYSDLMVHRYLKQYLFEKRTDELSLERNEAFISKASNIINDTESNSVDTEREVIKVCMVEYMSDKVGKLFDGVISVALKFGTFVQLENMVEGLVHISQFPDGTVYDERMQTLTTPQNKIYRMGDKVKIKVTKSDIKTRKIDFEFIQ